MPELPEVERVRLTLAERIVGQTVTKIALRRTDVVRFAKTTKGDRTRRTVVHKHQQLLKSQRIVNVERHGKQLAIIATQATSKPKSKHQATGQLACQCVCVHLGMSGSLIHRFGRPKSLEPHTHVVWHLSDGGLLAFRDPRRFGGIWTFNTLDDLKFTRWSKLGPDALAITPRQLHKRLKTTSRGLKAALLDQNLIAGMGNIYVDELLFQCKIHPQQPANLIEVNDVQLLVRKMKKLLHRAVANGGSSLRDYVDGEGRRGDFQLSHLVYGHAGEPCSHCGSILTGSVVAGRTTVFCSTCQLLKT